MTREQDWRIHEYMGNDLTGWRWAASDADTPQGYAVIDGPECDSQGIPHYSTTWEGAGLVMEWLRANQIYFGLSAPTWTADDHYKAVVNIDRINESISDASGPQALANAFIAAMEEIRNG